MKPFVRPLRLRSLGVDASRKVTWLELFFDLIFVAAVSQVAEPLREHDSLVGLVRFAPLFVLIWWAWTGHTVFSTRFDTDDVVQRGLTLVQMFAVAVMAANAKDALDSRSSAGFAAAYAAVRFVLVAQYFRAGRLPEAVLLPCDTSSDMVAWRFSGWRQRSCPPLNDFGFGAPRSPSTSARRGWRFGTA